MSELSIIMYHYVRPIKKSRFPGIKGLELDGFKRQLDYLENNYSIVTTDDVIDSVIKKTKLPEKSCWLTFDDGYKDHYLHVFPELKKRGLSGAFFIPRVAIEDSIILDVNAVHHILSCTKNLNLLFDDLKILCIECGINIDQFNNFYKEFAVANRFDDAKTIFIKRMLQHALPEEVRNFITSKLFENYVEISPSEFSSELYMSIDEAKELSRHGMYVGSHGSMHYWLDRISYDKQKEDILASLNFLEEIGTSISNWAMCYPFGAYNAQTLSLMRELNASIGVTTIPRKAIIGVDNSYELPRFDTNDFPQ